MSRLTKAQTDQLRDILGELDKALAEPSDLQALQKVNFNAGRLATFIVLEGYRRKN